MSVQNITRRAGPYVGTGLVSAFTFAFKVFRSEDVKVLRSASSDASAQDETLKFGTDYTVKLNANQDEKAGGTVTLASPLAEGLRLSILSAITPDQQMVLTNHDGFLPTTLNNTADKAIALIQELKEEVGRSLRVPASSDKTPEDMTEELMSAQEDARRFANAAQQSADSAKKSEEKTAEYAEAATILVPMKDEIKIVADNIDNVVTVGQSIEDVKTVSAANAEVVTVGKNIEFVKTVADANNLASVHTVAGVSEQVVRTAAISADVVTVASVSDHVINVSRNMDDVKNVSDGMPDIQTVAGDLAGGKCTQQKFTAGRLTDTPAQDCTVEGGNIKTVADHIASVDKVAGTVDDGTLEKAANSIETTAENVSRAEAAQTAAEKAQTAAEFAKAAADTSANNSSDSAVLSKKWATQTTAPVEGELYGAKYYADKAQGAQAESANILSAVRTEGNNQIAEATAQANAAAQSAQNAETSKTGAEKAQGAAEAAKGAVETAKEQAEAAATTAANQATAAEASANKAKEYANQASTGQMQANWNETDSASKAFILNKPDVYTKGEVDTKLETSSAGADSVQLCQQLIGFYNGVTGESLDYRDYLDHKPQEYLDAFYTFGVGYEGVTNGANA